MLTDAVRGGVAALTALTGLKVSGVVGIRPEGDGWLLSVELVEKESVPHALDVLGLYEVRLDAAGRMVGFGRVALRHRGDTAAPGGV